MKSLLLFAEYVLSDLGTWCDVSTHRDFKTVAGRFEDEGLSFLTITLADFGKAFDSAISQGQWIPSECTNFSHSKGLPRFLGGFLDRVFDRTSGKLLEDADVTAIWAIRQFTLMWAKIELPATRRRQKAALRAFLECDAEVSEYDVSLLRNRILLDRCSRIITILYADLLSDIDRQINDEGVVPRHGPGSTADGLLGNEKWRQLEWTRRLEELFPHWEMLVPNERFADARLDHVNLREPWEERPVKVTLVPKTLKTPRVIAIEPTCMQYVQQGLKDLLVDGIERDDLLSHLIGFSDQLPNQVLAREGSATGSLATLDLSEASDRVSTLHVELILANHSITRDAVFACRSSKAEVPGEGIHYLSKYASMGSALTFPLEAMVFLSVVLVGIESSLNRRLTKRDIRALAGRVRVYGDDIIVPVEHVSSVMESLETFGFRVNASKSHWIGKFRESCGKDYFDGQDISISKVRRVFPSSRAHAREIVSTVSLRNQCYMAGLWRAANFLDNLLERLIPFPYVEETSPILGRVSFLGLEPVERIHPDYHSPLVKGHVVRAKSPIDPLDDYAALMKCFVLHSRKPSEDTEHLQRGGRPKTVRTRVTWASPF